MELQRSLLMDALGVITVKVFCDPTGHFPHNPEPLNEHLSVLAEKVVEEKADFGIAVDPDVDRLVFVDENGSFLVKNTHLLPVRIMYYPKRQEIQYLIFLQQWRPLITHN